MKKLLISLVALAGILVPAASVSAAPCNYACQYKKVYGPNGTYTNVYKNYQQNVYGPQGSYTQTYDNIYGVGGLYCQLYGYNC